MRLRRFRVWRCEVWLTLSGLGWVGLGGVGPVPDCAWWCVCSFMLTQLPALRTHQSQALDAKSAQDKPLRSARMHFANWVEHIVVWCIMI